MIAEGRLIAGEQDVRDGPLRVESHVVEESVIQSAKPIRASRKRERVADEGPRDPDEAERDVAHHHGVERVLGSHQSAVEESEGGSHHQHHCGGDQHPCCVGGVYGAHADRLYGKLVLNDHGYLFGYMMDHLDSLISTAVFRGRLRAAEDTLRRAHSVLRIRRSRAGSHLLIR